MEESLRGRFRRAPQDAPRRSANEAAERAGEDRARIDHCQASARWLAMALLLAVAGCGRDELSEEHRDERPSAPSPGWSIESARILFTASRKGASDLYVLDRGSGETSRLTNLGTPNGGANQGRISPDGTSVAFQVRRGNDYDIYVMRLADGTPQHVIRHPEYDVNPVWSPDGERLAFMSTRGFELGSLGSFPGHLYILDLARGTVGRLTEEPLTSALGPSDWSANGASILFARRSGKLTHVLLIDVATGSESQVTRSTESDYSAAFSNSGDRIAFHAEREDGAHIVVSDLDGRNRRTVTTGSGFRYGPQWSPDDRWLMFSASEDGTQYDIRAVRLADGAVLDLVSTPEDEREGRWFRPPG